jgi:tRNA threonylcarbamoyladenosine dehydratase
VNAPGGPLAELLAADLERRFGGLRRLYGDSGYQAVRALRVAVVGVGGVGSWAAEALARCGVASLVLIDMDHVAESNINRQVHAVGATVGQAKVLALKERIADIHPGCEVWAVESFVEAPARADAIAGPPDLGNWPDVLPAVVDVTIDACDQRLAKLALASHALQHRTALVIAGAAGGKRHGHQVDVGDLADVTHDPLLAALRQNLRRSGAAPRLGAIGLRCVFSRESVSLPSGGDDCDACAATDGSLNCHGYGSTVTVTAAFGLAAAGEAIEWALAAAQAAANGSAPKHVVSN